MVEFEDINKNLPNGENMGGIPQIVYYGTYEDVLSWPKRPDASVEGMTLEKMGELTGDLKLKGNKRMFSFYVTDDEGKLEFESVGEKDGKSFVEKLRIYNPGLQSKLLGFVNLAKNGNLFFLVPDNNGNYYLMGDEQRAATMDSIDGMTTGQKTEERPGAGLVFTYKTANIYHYTGMLPIVATPEVPPVEEGSGVEENGGV